MDIIFRCPVTKGPLYEASPEELTDVNYRIVRGEIAHLDTTPVQRPLQRALVSADGHLLYPIENDVFFLLPAFAIALRPLSPEEVARYALREEKRVVQEWYDQYGWQEGDGGKCLDALAFGDYRPVSQEYAHRSHVRLGKYIPPHGKYLLDVASGALPQPEYLAYSQGYEKRVCVDLSYVALQACKKKLGPHGAYVLGDITNLPFQDDVFDTVLSMHTLYHVPADEQGNALSEMYRVLKQGSVAIIIYNWGRHSLLMRMADLPLNRFTFAVVRAAKKALGRQTAARSHAPSLPPPPSRGLYFHAHDLKWFKRQLQSRELTLACWRSMHQTFLLYYIRPKFFGRQILRAFYWWEERFPRLAGRLGQFPIFIIRKTIPSVRPAGSPVNLPESQARAVSVP